MTARRERERHADEVLRTFAAGDVQGCHLAIGRAFGHSGEALPLLATLAGRASSLVRAMNTRGFPLSGDGILLSTADFGQSIWGLHVRHWADSLAAGKAEEAYFPAEAPELSARHAIALAAIVVGLTSLTHAHS
jgi:hypothetical protein